MAYDNEEVVIIRFVTAVGLVALNTHLGCLDANLTTDSEAQKMITAANNSFKAMNQLEFGLPIWKFFKTPMLKELYEAQDFFTEYVNSFEHLLLLLEFFLSL